MRESTWARTVVVAAAVVAAVTACGDDDAAEPAATTASQDTATTAATTASQDTTTTAATTASQDTATTTVASTVGEQPAYVATLQPQIEQAMKDNVIPGALVLIESPEHGDWQATFGTGEIGKSVPLTMDDSFRIGSNTKTMTSTIIMQLVQEGKLKLDDPISKFRPDVPGGENITIQQLAEMRRGLYSYSFDPGFNETLDKDPQKAWTPDELLKIAFSHPSNGPPGETFDYSNTNIVLLGVVIEQLTGMSAHDAFQQRIFEPLGLTHTELPEPTDASIPDPHPQGYQFGTNVETINSYAVPAAELPDALDGSLQPINQTDANPSWGWTAGAGISTAEDLAVYVKALVGGGLLDPATQQIRLDSIQPTNPANPNVGGYGIGLARFGTALIGHDGQIPGYSTVMVYDPKAENTVIILTNLAAVPATGEGAALVILKLIVATLYGAAAVPSGDPAAVPGATTTTTG
jgi:CubicO group peptidase (beta-lactamase class C family)